MFHIFANLFKGLASEDGWIPILLLHPGSCSVLPWLREGSWPRSAVQLGKGGRAGRGSSTMAILRCYAQAQLVVDS